MSSRKVNKDVFIRQTRLWFEKYAGYKRLEDAQAVIGISGGKDSSVVAALLKESLGTDNVLGVMLPNNEQSDIQDARDLVKFLGIYQCTLNIGSAYDDIIEHLGAVFCTEEEVYGMATPIEKNKNVITNLPARLRMSILYAMANFENRRVVGTGNKSEILCGYYTLFGDGACDFDPIADLYVDEVIELGKQLGVPDRFLLKEPNDGMSGIPDEEKLGFKYSDVKIFSELPYHVAIKKLGEEKFDKISKQFTSTAPKRNLTHIPFIGIDGTLRNMGFTGFGILKDAEEEIDDSF